MFAQSMRSRTLIRMMPLYSGVACTTDRGRQKPLTLCNDTPQSSRDKPVWLFSVGTFGDQHPIIGGLMKKEPREIGEFEQAVHPRDYRVFAGVIDLDHWPAWGRLLFKALGGHAGDNRQWSDIDAWAEQISHDIRAQD